MQPHVFVSAEDLLQPGRAEWGPTQTGAVHDQTQGLGSEVQGLRARGVLCLYLRRRTTHRASGTTGTHSNFTLSFFQKFS